MIAPLEEKKRQTDSRSGFKGFRERIVRVSLGAFILATISGCASVVGEENIEWFARVSGEPRMINYPFCISAAPETEDGRNPSTRGDANMACGNDLAYLKDHTVAACERDNKRRCMPVYYFERNKHEHIQTFEEENMTRIAAEKRRKQIQAEKQNAERLARICDKYGFVRKTPGHATCVMKQSQHEQAMKLQQDRLSNEKRLAEQLDWDRRMEQLRRAQEMLRNDGKSSNSSICRPRSDGVLVCD